jgi:hypothetical protein
VSQEITFSSTSVNLRQREPEPAHDPVCTPTPDFSSHAVSKLRLRPWLKLVLRSVQVGCSEIVGRIVEDLKDESEPYRRMVMETIDKVHLPRPSLTATLQQSVATQGMMC